MTFYVKDPATDRAVRRLAKLKGKTLTETIREAVEKEYRLSKAKPRNSTSSDRFRSFRAVGLRRTRHFYELSGDRDVCRCFGDHRHHPKEPERSDCPKSWIGRFCFVNSVRDDIGGVVRGTLDTGVGVADFWATKAVLVIDKAR
jgi:antitoxin VapB